ncbi:WD40/YVTN/BNR-like repeat-containing protein [Microbacterium aureliae]
MRTTLRAAAVAATLLPLALTGCAAAAPPDEEHADIGTHVHAVIPDPAGEGFLLGTHGGLVAVTADGELGDRIGRDDFDAMGLAAGGETLFASGHPGSATPEELGSPHLGIIRSDDGGLTWAPVAFTGEKDFHVLAGGLDGELYGQATDSGQVLRSVDGGATWAPTGTTLPAFALAVDAAGRVILAGPEGPRVSDDQGATFGRLTDAPSLFLVSASADRARLVGVDRRGDVWTTSAPDAAWERIGAVHGTVQAVGIDDRGDVLVVDDSGLTLLTSSDG